MYNWFYDGKRFKNGNLNIRFSPDDIEEIKNNPHIDDMFMLSEKLFNFDTTFTGEENYYYNKQSWILYSFYSHKEFEIFSSDIEKLMNGKTVKLYARKPSEETLLRMGEQ